MTYVTLSVLLLVGIYGMYNLLDALRTHDKITDSKLNKPLKNKNKWWYN